MFSSFSRRQLPPLAPFSRLLSFPRRSLRTSFIFSAFSAPSAFFSRILVSLLGAVLISFRSPSSPASSIFPGITRFYFYYQLLCLKVTRFESLATGSMLGFFQRLSLELRETLLNLARHSSTASRETEACVWNLDSEFPLLLLERMEILLKCMEVLWLCSLSSPLSRSISS